MKNACLFKDSFGTMAINRATDHVQYVLVLHWIIELGNLHLSFPLPRVLRRTYSLWQTNMTAQIELDLEEQESNRDEILNVASLSLLDL